MNEYRVIIATIDNENNSRWVSEKVCARSYETDAGGSLHFFDSERKIRSFSEGSWIEVIFVGTQKENE